MRNIPNNLMCFSHLRWDFVYQRPQHLLTRFSENFNVYFLEEPIFDSVSKAHIKFSKRNDKLWVGVPHLPAGMSKEEVNSTLTQLLDIFFENQQLENFAFWYYTPMALEFSAKYRPQLTIFDCMDELSAFKFAPQELKDREKELLRKADVVFTGGHSLYEAKKNQHANIFPFPSSIEKDHFAKARKKGTEPADQAGIKGVKLGFYGVLDERFDIELIRGIADARPEWQIILIGPVAKISPDILPKNQNIHYMGQKSYNELPAYLSGWDVALIPFMLNESTRYISPTKTPEYLAGGKPVVSTPIRDVVQPYGVNRLVHIASNADEFVQAIEQELKAENKAGWLAATDKFLEANSWDNTYKEMMNRITETLASKRTISLAS